LGPMFQSQTAWPAIMKEIIPFADLSFIPTSSIINYDSITLQFQVTFYGVVICVTVYSLFLGLYILMKYSPNSPIAPVIYRFLPGVLFITIVKKLFSPFLCKFDDTRGAYYMYDAPSIECWNTNTLHKYYCLAALICLLFYSCTALFVSSYRADVRANGRCDINYIPQFSVIDYTIKDVFCFVTTFFIPISVVFTFAAALVVVLFLLFINLYMTPSSYYPVNIVKAGSLIAVIWGIIITIFIEMTGQSTIAVVLIFVGWAIIIGITGYLTKRKAAVLKKLGRYRDLTEYARAANAGK